MEVSEWVKAGECNDCGWCCENVGRYSITVASPDSAYLEIRGAKHSEHGLTLEGDFCAPCPQHVDNQCAIYDFRPTTCRNFPSEPNEIIKTPCSYWFERSVVADDGTITFEKIGGKGSPFPVL